MVVAGMIMKLDGPDERAVRYRMSGNERMVTL